MDAILVHTLGGVATIQLNRPATRNAFDAAAISALTRAFEELPASVRVVVLAGAGETFCAGADLQWMQQTATLSQEENRRDAAALAGLFATIDAAPQAVIGKVHGAALGGGGGLVACCDIVIAAEGTRFGFTEARLGIVPAVIAPFVIRKIGVGQARRYFLTGEIFDARVACALGLVHQTVAAAELDSTVEGIVAAILKCGPIAVMEAKKLVAEVSRRTPRDAAAYTTDTIARLRVSPEGQEGLAAFLGKRKPSWA